MSVGALQGWAFAAPTADDGQSIASQDSYLSGQTPPARDLPLLDLSQTHPQVGNLSIVNNTLSDCTVSFSPS